MPGYFLVIGVLTGNHSINNKNFNMKKFFFVLAIGAFAACNNSSSTEAKTDSTAKTADSAIKMADSATKMADTAKKMADTARKMAADTTKK